MTCPLTARQLLRPATFPLRWRAASCCLLLVAALLAGCGPAEPQEPTSTITLMITSAGKPVSLAAVQLVAPGEGRGAFGHLDENGSVTFPDVEPGSYTVTVMPPAPPLPDPERAALPQPDYSAIPDQVRDQTTSPLRLELPPGEHTYRFELVE